MNLREEILDLQPSHGPSCGMTTLLTTLEPKIRTEFLEVLKDQTIRHKTFSRWAEKRGMRISADTVSRHRRGECGCGRS